MKKLPLLFFFILLAFYATSYAAQTIYKPITGTLTIRVEDYFNNTHSKTQYVLHADDETAYKLYR